MNQEKKEHVDIEIKWEKILKRYMYVYKERRKSLYRCDDSKVWEMTPPCLRVVSQNHISFSKVLASLPHLQNQNMK